MEKGCLSLQICSLIHVFVKIFCLTLKLFGNLLGKTMPRQCFICKYDTKVKFLRHSLFSKENNLTMTEYNKTSKYYKW